MSAIDELVQKIVNETGIDERTAKCVAQLTVAECVQVIRDTDYSYMDGPKSYEAEVVARDLEEYFGIM